MPSNLTATCPVAALQVPAAAKDVEKAGDSVAKTTSSSQSLDIEHVDVEDDPRKWSHMRKVSCSLIMIHVVATGLDACYRLPLAWCLDEHTMPDLLSIDDGRPWREHVQPWVSAKPILAAPFTKRTSLEAAIKQVETDLRTTSGKISLSIAIFIIFQGGVPLLWSSISEIKGRKVRTSPYQKPAFLRCFVSLSPSTSSLLRLDWWDI